MTDTCVLVAGGGIGGLATALTLHQVGVPCRVFETAPEMLPLGVGINLQPNAVRELIDLGISEADLDTVGCRRGSGPSSVSTAAISMPNREAVTRATSGRSMPCIAASST